MAIRTQPLGPLVLALVLLLFASPLSAAIPYIWTEPNSPQNSIDRFQAAWKDCIQLARVAVITWTGRCDPIYQRYLEVEGDAMVLEMFQSIANIPLDTVLNPANIQQILTSGTVVGMNPKFFSLFYSFGEPPWIPEVYKGTCEEDDFFGSFITHSDKDEDVTIVLCSAAVKYPLLSELLDPPPTAFDAQGTLLEGYGCDGLLDRNTECMDNIGGFILHELIHWAYLFEDIPRWDNFIVPYPGAEEDIHLIEDWPGPAPPTGYGPYRTARIKQQGITNPDEGNPFPALNNAANYVWYAISKYFE